MSDEPALKDHRPRGVTRFFQRLTAMLLCCMAGCAPSGSSIGEHSRRPEKDAFHIAWYEGEIRGLAGHLEFTYADTGRTVPARPAPAFDVTVPEGRDRLKSSSNWWLGAYCRDQEDFRLLSGAIAAIQAEFGHDPPGGAYAFPGEAFYFLTSMNKVPASKR